MPDSAVLAIASPNPAETAAQWLGVAGRLSGGPDRIDSAVNAWTGQVGALFDYPDAISFAAIARVYGIDPEAPAALFLGPSEGGAKSAAPASAEVSSSPPTPENGTRPGPIPLDRLDWALGSLALEALHESSGGADGHHPAWYVALAARCSAPETTERELDTLFSRVARHRGSLPVRLAGSGFDIHYYSAEIPCFFIAGRQAVLSNSLPMLQEVAERLAAPAPIVYGSPTCPAHAVGESVILVRSYSSAGAPAVSADQPEAAKKSLLSVFASHFASPDPAVVTFLAEGETLRVRIRADLSTHPELQRLYGDPVPWRHRWAVPDNTVAIAAMSFSAGSRDALSERWLAALPSELAKDPQFEQVAAVVHRVTRLLGGVATVALGACEDGTKAPVILVDLADVADAREFLLTLGMPPTVTKTHADVEILSVPNGFGLPFPVFYAFCGGTLVTSTRIEAVTTAIDRLLQKPAAAPVRPDLPLGAEEPMFRIASLQKEGLQALLPLLSVLGIGGTDSSGLIPQAFSQIDQLSWTTKPGQGAASTWLDSQISITLADPAPPNPSGKQDAAHNWTLPSAPL